MARANAQDPRERVAHLEEENRVLRERVLELERAASRFEGGARASVPKETLSEREALLVEAERIVHMGSWVWDVATDQVAWSDELFRILGYDSTTDRPSAEAFFQAVHPEDRERIAAQSKAAVTTGVAGSAECRVQWRDGTVRRVTMSGATLFDEQGVLRRIVGTVLDVTEAQRAAEQVERALTLLAEAQHIAQVGSWAYQPTTGKLEWSAELHRILGVPESASPSEEGFFAALHEEDRERVRQLFARSLADGGRTDARVVRPDGTIGHVHIVLSPLRDAAGGVTELRGTVLDVTRRVELEEQLLRGQKLDALGRLSGGVAHDFNNLLTVILGNVEILKRELPARALPWVQQIEQASELAAKLTRQLLAFARRAHLAPQIVVLNALLDDALTMTRRLIGENIRLESAFEADLWPVRVDIGQLQQSVLNLVVNARDAMPEGGTITVRTRNAIVDEEHARGIGLAAGEYVVLSVSDTGLGMDPATRARIFEPFFTTKAEGIGSGLGLAVVFGAVSQHGGAIMVDSEPDTGTTFSIYLPRCPAKESTQKPSAAPRSKHGARGHILLVEDDAAVASVMKAALEGAGYRVDLALLPSAALALWQRPGGFDLVVTDVMMPEMRGPELVASLARLGPAPRVLYVTGYGPDLFGERREAREHPVLEKPFKTEALLSAVASALEARATKGA